VIWNALILHARWAGLVQSRGVAGLSLVGNIVTTWSWFGVNMLGVGLHSYGFMEGAAFGVFSWVLLNVVMIGACTMPPYLWLDDAKRAKQPEPIVFKPPSPRKGKKPAPRDAITAGSPIMR
jgi:hypothetical protein